MASVSIGSGRRLAPWILENIERTVCAGEDFGNGVVAIGADLLELEGARKFVLSIFDEGFGIRMDDWFLG